MKIVEENPELIQQISTMPNSFTRNRKLTFSRLALLIAKLCKKTLSVELDHFFAEIGSDMECSVSAFSQQRMKLSPAFFMYWNQLLCSCFYHYYGSEVKRWKGYRVIASDGSRISLVNTTALDNYFGGQKNQSSQFVQAKAFYSYDVLNEVIIHAQIAPYRVSEITMALPAMDAYKSDMIVIYDRYFCSYKMVALHQWQEKESKFVIRATTTQNLIKKFIENGKWSEVVYLKPTQSAKKGLKMSGYLISKKDLLKVRLIRVELPDSVQVLMTNLWEEEGHTPDVFKELYFLRWRIETNISLQKNIIQLESFSGQTPVSVQQDFFATVFITNLFSLILKQAQTEVSQVKNRKHPLKVNLNKSFGKFRLNFVSLFMEVEPEVVLKLLHQHFIRNPLPVRKNRKFPRVRKNRQNNSKHKMFLNYKPSF